MKTSVSLALFETAASMPVLFSGNIEENIPYIKEIGYNGLDLLIRDPKADISIQAKKLLAENDLGVSVILPAALASEGLFMCAKDEHIRNMAIHRMAELVVYASEVGGNLAVGLPRGSYGPEETEEEALKRFIISTERLLPQAEKYGVRLCVEPINRYEINTLNNAKATADFVRASGLPLRMMPDSFHMNIEDVSIVESICYCGDLIEHFHFVDSNRLAPGMGHTDMDKVLAALKEVGYDNYLGLEVLPRPDAKTCALKGIEYFKKVGLA